MPEKSAKRKTGKKHIVVFQDAAGAVLKTSFVAHGEAAVPPAVPAKIPFTGEEAAHYELCFQGWNEDVSHVADNLVVRAVYEKTPKKYLVMYFHENGKPIATETVPYGGAAKQDCFPEKSGTEEFEYVFAGWNTDLSRIEGDTMAKAVFKKKRRAFSVSFFHEDGTLLKKEQVFYGQDAAAPEAPEKEADKVFHYIFAGWDREFSHVTGETIVHAIFTPVYNEYTVRFLERMSGREKGFADDFAAAKDSGFQEKIVRTENVADFFAEDILIEEKIYHYQEKIVYPQLEKKGYTLIWDSHPEMVEGDADIHAHWEFTNPKGKIVSYGGNVFRITNPSVTNGAVRLLQYQSDAVCVEVPPQVRLGDYYYRIEEIGARAFDDCLQMKKICLPDTVYRIRKDGLSGCRRLETAILGEKLHYIEEKAFREDPCLKTVIFSGKEIRRISRRAWEGMRKRVAIIKK